MRFVVMLVLGLIILTAPLEVCWAGGRERPSNYISGELGGRTMVGVTYERLLTNRFGVGAGVGVLATVFMSYSPSGDDGLYLSLGAATNLMTGGDPGDGVLPTLTIAFLHRSESGFFLRIGTTIYAIFPAPGIAIGRSF